jgi:hypothetical protein
VESTWVLRLGLFQMSREGSIDGTLLDILQVFRKGEVVFQYFSLEQLIRNLLGVFVLWLLRLIRDSVLVNAEYLLFKHYGCHPLHLEAVYIPTFFLLLLWLATKV